MNMKKSIISILIMLLSSSVSIAAETQTRRYALVAGCNHGGQDRVLLKYATTDAQAVSDLLNKMGGVRPPDTQLLLNPSKDKLLAAIAKLKQEIESLDQKRQRIELVFYYSGHSDENGLLMFGERLSYADLRKHLDGVKADVRVGILDSCASGAFTRLKGGKIRAPFLFDESSKVKGYAYLASSSASEAAQESERIKRSFFTHYLLSGLMGAADNNQNGRVTLNEAYQFAYHETLARTEKTYSGAQHPAYEFNLAGQGDLVITDLRGTSASLVLPESLQGRVFLHDQHGNLAAELNKVPGRRIVLGMDPGEYRLVLSRKEKRFQVVLELAEGKPYELTEEQLELVVTEESTDRGDDKKAKKKKTIGINVGLWPPLSINGEDNKHYDITNYFSLTLAASMSSRLRGISICPGGSYFKDSMYGLQLTGFAGLSEASSRGGQISGLFNFVKGSLNGFQLSGLINIVAESLIGLQVSTFNAAVESMNGVQLGALINVAAKDGMGLQISGVANIGKQDFWGIQIGGFNHQDKAINGIQAGYGANISGEVNGGQISLVNVSGDVDGLQLGLVNIAARVRGVQLGLVNVAQEVKGVPFGLFSWVENGHHNIDVWASEMSPFNFGLKFGSRYFYSLFFGGIRPVKDQTQWNIGLGLGVNIPIEPFFIKFDLMGSNVRYDFQRAGGENVYGQLRLMAGWQPHEHFSVYAGGSLNIFAAPEGQTLPLAIGTPQVEKYDDVWVSIWPGFFIGLQI
jgi:hypothetical protein